MAMLWSFNEIVSVARVDSALEKTGWPFRELTRNPAKLESQLAELENAARLRWDDAEAHLALANLWMQRYRLRGREQLREQLNPVPDDEELWLLTSPDMLHLRAMEAAHSQNNAQLLRLRAEPLILANVGQAWRHLELARKACPLLPQVHFEMARICFLAEPPEHDIVHLNRVERLASWQAGLMYYTGLAHLRAGRDERGWWCLSRAWQFDRVRYGTLVQNLARERLTVPEMIKKVFPPWPAMLVSMAQSQYAAPEQAADRAALLARAAELVDTTELPEDERQYLLGVIQRLNGNNEAALEYLKKAVELRTQDASWRYELATLLFDLGMYTEAREQASWCLRMDPRRRAVYEELLKKIHLAQAAATVFPRTTQAGQHVAIVAIEREQLASHQTATFSTSRLQ